MASNGDGGHQNEDADTTITLVYTKHLFTLEY